MSYEINNDVSLLNKIAILWCLIKRESTISYVASDLLLLQ